MYLRPYVNSFCQIFQALHLFSPLRQENRRRKKVFSLKVYTKSNDISKNWVLVFSLMYFVSVDPMDRSYIDKYLHTLKQFRTSSSVTLPDLILFLNNDSTLFLLLGRSYNWKRISKSRLFSFWSGCKVPLSMALNQASLICTSLFIARRITSSTSKVRNIWVFVSSLSVKTR